MFEYNEVKCSDIKDVEVNSFLDSCDFFCLLIAYANSLNPDQDKQSVLIGSKVFDTLIVFLKEFLKS